VAEGSRVVCLLTGHGLKDPDQALAGVERPAPIPATRAAIERIALA
jgi:threonine synthase